MGDQFVRCMHSEYCSLLDGRVRIKQLIQRVSSWVRIRWRLPLHGVIYGAIGDFIRK